MSFFFCKMWDGQCHNTFKRLIIALSLASVQIFYVLRFLKYSTVFAYIISILFNTSSNREWRHSTVYNKNFLLASLACAIQ